MDGLPEARCAGGRQILPFARACEGRQKWQRAEYGEEDPIQEDTISILGAETANDHPGHDEGDEAPEDREPHAPSGQRSTLIIVQRQFGRQCKVWHVHHGRDGVVEDVDGAIVERQPVLRGDWRAPPHQREYRCERQRSEQEVRAAPPPARARAVRQVAYQRVVDPIPLLGHQDDQTGQAGPHPDHVRQKEQEVDADQRAGQRKAGVPEAVEDLGAPGEAFVGRSHAAPHSRWRDCRCGSWRSGRFLLL